VKLSPLLAAVTLGGAASAQSPPTVLQSLPGGPGYITAPDWASKPGKGTLDLYRPERAYLAGVPGGAVVECVAQTDGHLIQCKTLEVRPAGWEYEYAGPKAVSSLYRLKPMLANGQSVAGKRVVVTLIWK